MHEGLHAELRRIYEGNNQVLEPLPEVQFNYLVSCWEYYKGVVTANQVSNYASHTYMVYNHLEPLAIAIRELDDNHYDLNHYMWSGLTTTDIFLEQYPVYLDPDDEFNNPFNYNPEYLEIKLIIQAESFNTTQTFIHPNGNTYEFNPKGYTPNETTPCN
jgi:hypothetical protein